ncbi:hypothetical protein HBH53_097060 [Parastagonospora nodorum]|nr:hypothetical protein HBH53_097060 [Parastagonospora nodorum]KAH3993316.1 hypothetical protein HBI10_206200 [Parastagonospora nodorum]KAH4011229.1 hypothetical protein HBI13_201950 [Parastagonospora nodorum]KAH5002133.1 hypothetical protein HBI74_246210 [Parastagonospora nodorum]KAH5092655.1 hypothetical protein HBH72_187680 [Parastagonospora nodorum]
MVTPGKPLAWALWCLKLSSYMLPLLFAIPLIVAQQRHAIQRALWDHDLETLALPLPAAETAWLHLPRPLRPCCLGTRLLSLRQHQQTSVLLPTPASSPSLEHTLHRL